MPSPILARADALMHRRQHPTVPDDVPTLTEAIGDDGIPLLLNIEIAAPSLDEPAATTCATEQDNSSLPTARFDDGERDHLIRELARRVEQRLLAELPHIIEATVRDFAASSELIRLEEDLVAEARRILGK